MNWVKEIANGLLSLAYPKICQSCGDSLSNQEEWICLQCNKELVPTGFWKYDDNPVFDIFVGRLPINRAFSFYYMENKSVLNALMHSIKYQGKKDAAIWLGRKMGELWNPSENDWSFIDAIIPIPLHEKRINERGFNQSSYLANGISEITKIPVLNNVVKRNRYSLTQTRKSRLERVDNVENIFSITAPEQVKDKNILILDDVVTTGATAESCMLSVLASGCKSVNFASLAMAV